MRIKTIWRVQNNTSVLFFEDKEDADKYAASLGAAAGINVCPVSLVTKDTFKTRINGKLVDSSEQVDIVKDDDLPGFLKYQAY